MRMALMCWYEPRSPLKVNRMEPSAAGKMGSEAENASRQTAANTREVRFIAI